MNHTILTDWFAQHHPGVDVGMVRWEANLPRHDAHDITAALNTWHTRNPETAPKPADITALLRKAAQEPGIARSRLAARQAIADSRQRALQASRNNHPTTPPPPAQPHREAS